MAFSDWSTTASSNTSVGGVSIAEGMTPGNVNNAMRAIMADLATAFNTSASPQFTSIELGHASDTTITRVSAGVIAVEGATLLTSGAAAPQFTTIELGHASDTTLARSGAGDITVEGNAVYRAGGTDVPITDGGTGASTAATAKVNLGLDGLSSRNAIINGAFNVAQRGTSFTDSGSANNDDSYTLDRWYVLSDGNDIVDVSQDTADVPTNGLYAAKMLVATVNKKFGLAQIIEQKNCIGLIGQTVTLSFQAKVNNTTRLDKIKAGIVAWSSTADSVTSDIVSAWGADGTTPTLIANCTFENTPADLGVTTSWASYSVSATIDTASTTNIIVFIWSDNVTDTDANDTLAIADVQLEYGAASTPFERRPYGHELLACKRYYWSVLSGSGVYINVGQAVSSTAVIGSLFYPVEMRAAPTAVVSDQTHFAVFNSTGGTVATTAFTLTTTRYSTRLDATVAAGLTAGNASVLSSNNASATLTLTAEL